MDGDYLGMGVWEGFFEEVIFERYLNKVNYTNI